MYKIFIAVLLICASSSIYAEQTQALGYQFNSFSYSEAVSVHDAINQWRGRFDGGSKAFTYNLSSVELYRGKYRLSLIHRYDYELQFTRDTAEFYYLTDNQKDLEINRNYQLDLKVKNHYSRGVQLNYEFKPRHDITLNVGAAYLQGLKLTDGRLNGHASVLSNNDYDFQFDLEYFYSRDTLLERRVDEPSGNGFATDLSASWQVTPRWQVQANIKDLLSRIYWLKTPRTTGKASSDTKKYDENGYVVFAPALSGIEDTRFFEQKLSPRLFLINTYRINDYHLDAEIDVFPLQTIYVLGGSVEINRQWVLSTAYLAPVNAFRVGLQRHEFVFSLVADHKHLMDSNTVALLLSFRLDFN